jgi:hypothetical protein
MAPMKIIMFSLIVIFHVQGFAQNEVTLSLNPVKGQLIEFETDEAKIYFAKTDFLKSFSDFKKSVFHDLEEEKQHAFTEAFKQLEKTRNTVSLRLVKDVEDENQDPLVYFIKIYGGAVLLNERKAEVLNKLDNKKQSEILKRQIDSPQGVAYMYSFKNGGKFFLGEVYGEHSTEPTGRE